VYKIERKEDCYLLTNPITGLAVLFNDVASLQVYHKTLLESRDELDQCIKEAERYLEPPKEIVDYVNGIDGIDGIS
jgi:hypothetical protein